MRKLYHFKSNLHQLAFPACSARNCFLLCSVVSSAQVWCRRSTNLQKFAKPRVLPSHWSDAHSDTGFSLTHWNSSCASALSYDTFWKPFHICIFSQDGKLILALVVRFFSTTIYNVSIEGAICINLQQIRKCIFEWYINQILRNIARGTTDPVYWFLNWIEFSTEMFIIF